MPVILVINSVILFQPYWTGARLRFCLDDSDRPRSNFRELGIIVMKSSNNLLFARCSGVARTLTFVTTLALLSSGLLPGVNAQHGAPAQTKTLNEDQRVLHVLNRLGFGARPGDVARVKAMGLDKYINQQLNPQKISDAVADSKIKDLLTLNMTTAQLY